MSARAAVAPESLEKVEHSGGFRTSVLASDEPSRVAVPAGAICVAGHYGTCSHDLQGSRAPGHLDRAASFTLSSHVNIEKSHPIRSS